MNNTLKALVVTAALTTGGLVGRLSAQPGEPVEKLSQFSLSTDEHVDGGVGLSGRACSYVLEDVLDEGGQLLRTERREGHCWALKLEGEQAASLIGQVDAQR